MDYNGVMGVPITFLDKYNPEQFEIIGNEIDLNIEKGRGYVNGKRMYSRIFIRRRQRVGAHNGVEIVETCHGAFLRTEPSKPYPQSDPALPMAAEPDAEYGVKSKL